MVLKQLSLIFEINMIIENNHPSISREAGKSAMTR